MQIPYLKPFVEWVTGLTDRYRQSPFVQSTVHIVTIQIALAVLLIAVAGWAIFHTQSATVASIHQYISQLHEGVPIASSTLTDTIAHTRDKTIAFAFVAIVILNIVFGMLLIRFALSPTKSSVEFQKRFIGNIAHEIRTPLAIIKTSSEVALMDDELKPDVRETFQDTITELNRISEIINNLLSLDTLIHPKHMKLEPISLVPIAQKVLDNLRAFAESRDIGLSLTVRGHHTTVLGNAVALEEVFTNLIKNALNYTPKDQHGRVTMHIEQEFDDRIAVQVTDTGIGIAQKDLIHIFDPFYRGDTSRARNIGSGTSGLGLAIVKEITRIHRGAISVRSVVDKGTTIKISFPAVSATPKNTSGDSEPNDEVTEITMDFS